LAYNKRLARRRVVIEHINAKIKTFRTFTVKRYNKYTLLYRETAINEYFEVMNLLCKKKIA
jgi:hypothetical protein